MDNTIPEFSARLTRTQVTSPEIELRHYISNDELDILSDTKPGSAKDICLVALGGFLGSVIPAVSEISQFGSKDHPMGLIGLVTFALAVATIVAAAVAGWQWQKNENRHNSVVDRIRKRPKFEVR